MLTTRGEGQLPNPNEWNSTLTSAKRGNRSDANSRTNSKRRSAYGCLTNNQGVIEDTQLY